MSIQERRRDEKRIHLLLFLGSISEEIVGFDQLKYSPSLSSGDRFHSKRNRHRHRKRESFHSHPITLSFTHTISKSLQSHHSHRWRSNIVLDQWAGLTDLQFISAWQWVTCSISHLMAWQEVLSSIISSKGLSTNTMQILRQDKCLAWNMTIAAFSPTPSCLILFSVKHKYHT